MGFKVFRAHTCRSGHLIASLSLGKRCRFAKEWSFECLVQFGEEVSFRQGKKRINACQVWIEVLVAESDPETLCSLPRLSIMMQPWDYSAVRPEHYPEMERRKEKTVKITLKLHVKL